MWCNVEVNGEQYISASDVIRMIDNVGAFLHQAHARFSKEDSLAAKRLFGGLCAEVDDIAPEYWAKRICRLGEPALRQAQPSFKPPKSMEGLMKDMEQED